MDVQGDYGNVDQGIVQGGTEAQEDLQETAITSYEELEAYETDRMNGIVSAFADSGLSYSQRDKLRGYFGIIVKDWFGINMWSYLKYPYLKESHIILVPTKGEGLLNG